MNMAVMADRAETARAAARVDKIVMGLRALTVTHMPDHIILLTPDRAEAEAVALKVRPWQVMREDGAAKARTAPLEFSIKIFGTIK
jgi:hypothetical protein